MTIFFLSLETNLDIKLGISKSQLKVDDMIKFQLIPIVVIAINFW